MAGEAGPDGSSASLLERARLYEQACRVAGIGGWECDLATERLIWTDEVHRLFGLPLDTRPKRADAVALYVDESRETMEFLRAETIRSGRTFVLDAQIRTRAGELRWMRLSADVAFEGGKPVRLFGAKQDVTREREAWERLRQLADQDPLTGLANRRIFDAHYRSIVGDELNHGAVAALVLLDLDNFKEINDRFGHAAGDECLQRTAMRLQQAMSEARLVARIGGDEFAVLMRAPLGQARIAALLERARIELSKPILWNRTRLDMAVSIGATIIGRPHLRKLANLYGEADSALYAAKAAGRNRVCIFGREPERVPLAAPAARQVA